MTASLTQLMLFVQDVDALMAFYRDSFGHSVTEHTPREWAVLDTGGSEIALHRVGEPWRAPGSAQLATPTNAKLVFSVSEDLEGLRDRLLARNVDVGEIKNWPGAPGPLCDGRDPEGNVFQLVQVAR